jgi:hypothetical protein
MILLLLLPFLAVLAFIAWESWLVHEREVLRMEAERERERRYASAEADVAKYEKSQPRPTGRESE